MHDLVYEYTYLCLFFAGTIFLEFWKRKNATLAYEWDVNNFDETEPDRPQFHGTKRQEVSRKCLYTVNSLSPLSIFKVIFRIIVDSYDNYWRNS